MKEGIIMAKVVRVVQRAKIYHPKSERIKSSDESKVNLIKK